MVSSQFSILNGNNSQKPFLNQLLLPNGPPDCLPPSDCVDVEFSDLFGPSPVEASIAVSSENHENLVATRGLSEKIYNDHASIHIRSQSLLAPTTCVGQSLQISKLALHKAEDASDLVEEVLIETHEELKEHSVNNSEVEKNNTRFNNYCLNNQTIGVEDFEVLKVVGQGAFGKVYQVRRAGTSEIYAMKVMRKDKIMQGNHAEYVKSERDMLTKVDNPFIVRLRYAFQVMLLPE
uniref:Serine/threonine-protein kinase AtPK19 n=1 Tax=Cajanus cajan TaxID=3821 RepID=A0A151U0C4_CAJCA|nr:Serine/threonine-protein kinase AtPK19 [Cajanus cajan]